METVPVSLALANIVKYSILDRNGNMFTQAVDPMQNKLNASSIVGYKTLKEEIITLH